MAKQRPGSGRGNKGVSVVKDATRPDCHRCGSFMSSHGARQWECTNKECGACVAKNPKRPQYAKEVEFYNTLGYDGSDAKAQAKLLRKLYKKGQRRFVVTSAQNNTQVFEPFLESINHYLIDNSSELIVLPCHYKNLNAFTKGDDKSKWFDSKVEDYIVGEEVILGGVKIKADIPIEAPAANPLTGLHDVGGDFWTIYGHSQHSMMPVASHGIPKRMYTTGSITKRNFGKSKRGGKADFHHVIGALVIEIGDEHIFIRQINSDTKGRFYDLDKLYTPEGVSDGHSVDVLCTGDEHVKFNTVADVTYLDRDSVCNVLKPKFLVRHDLFDAYAVSHHHEKNPLVQFRKHHSGDANCREELDECIAFLDKTTPGYSTNIIVPSNHIDHLSQWLNRADANKDHENALLICELQSALRENALKGETTDPFEIYVKPKLKSKTTFLNRNEPWKRRGVDYSQHGDVGTNGARGSSAGLSKTVDKMTIGHSHSANITRGVFQVGVSTGKLEYERGLSTHTNTHCVQYVSGKRTLIDIFDNKWRL
jgi:hypothetical protein